MRNVTIIGAGIVGVCTARFLQNAGFKVQLVDRGEPVGETSFGNLGMLCSVEHALPLPSVDVLKSVPKMLFNYQSPLVMRWKHLPRLMPWLLRFIGNCNDKTRLRNAQALAALMKETLNAYTQLVEITPDARKFILQRGSLDLYRNFATFEKDAKERQRIRNLGVTVDELDSAEITQLEPAVSRDFRYGVYFPNSGHCLDPYGLGTTLFQAFLAAGGEFIQTEITGAELSDKKVTSLISVGGTIAVESIVLATGAWSGHLARALQSPVPMDTERGYHTMLHGVDGGISRPIGDVQNHVGLTQMNDGLRIGGTVELAGLNAPPDYKRAEHFYEKSRSLLPHLPATSQTEITRWMGYRPTLPDYLPVLGPSPHLDNAWFAFGHQHLGLSLAARTGQLITNSMAGISNDINLHPYRPNRFKNIY